MDGEKRFTFFLLVFFFAGSVVLIAAHELKNRSMKRREGTSAEARQLIHNLRGEASLISKEGYVDPGAYPTRRPGSYLQEHDKKKLNTLLQQLIPPADE